MALPQTTDFPVGKDWTLILAGPTTSGVYAEVGANPLLYRIETALPTSAFGHRLDADTHGEPITLLAGESLYAKGVDCETTIILTGE